MDLFYRLLNDQTVGIILKYSCRLIIWIGFFIVIYSISDSLDYMAVWQSGMFQPQTDMMETFTAKAEKRKPNFDDLSKIDNSSIL